MAIISFDKDEVVDYTPFDTGNRKRENPCVVRLRFVPYSRIQHYARLLAARTKEKEGSATAMTVMEASQEVQRIQFLENVESVAGYFIGSREITDPEEFYETAGIDLIMEVLKAMESQSCLQPAFLKGEIK